MGRLGAHGGLGARSIWLLPRQWPPVGAVAAGSLAAGGARGTDVREGWPQQQAHRRWLLSRMLRWQRTVLGRRLDVFPGTATVCGTQTTVGGGGSRAAPPARAAAELAAIEPSVFSALRTLFVRRPGPRGPLRPQPLSSLCRGELSGRFRLQAGAAQGLHPLQPLLFALRHVSPSDAAAETAGSCQRLCTVWGPLRPAECELPAQPFTLQGAHMPGPFEVRRRLCRAGQTVALIGGRFIDGNSLLSGVPSL